MSSVKLHWGDPRPTQMQSAKICQIFHFLVVCVCVGGLLQTNSNAKCQGLPKFSFSGGRGVTSDQLKIQSAKICPNFHFQGGRGGGADQLKSKVPRSAQIFIWGGGYSRPIFPKYLSGALKEF